PDKLCRKNCVIKTMRFRLPLHKSDSSAIIEDFYTSALQHFYFCHLSRCRIDRQPKPAAILLVQGGSQFRIIRHADENLTAFVELKSAHPPLRRIGLTGYRDSFKKVSQRLRGAGN